MEVRRLAKLKWCCRMLIFDQTRRLVYLSSVRPADGYRIAEYRVLQARIGDEKSIRSTNGDWTVA